MDEKALFKLSYGLYIISSSHNGHDAGCVANTLAQVTNSPNRLSIALNKNNDTTKVIQESGRFSAVVLAQGVDMEIIAKFGFHSSRDTEKFDQLAFLRDEAGVPYLTQHIAARVSVKVTGSLDLGTHILFVGELEEAEILSNEEVMTYAYYHQVKNGLTPKNAPSYQEVTPEKKVGWKCSVCGYIYEGDPLPADFICPICHQDASVFEKIV